MKSTLPLLFLSVTLLGGCKKESQKGTQTSSIPVREGKEEQPHPPKALRKVPKKKGAPEGPGKRTTKRTKTHSMPPMPPFIRVAEAINAMGVKLFTALTRDKGVKGSAMASAKRNVVLSAYSIASGLFLAWAGARGETEKEFARFIPSDLPSPRQHKAMGALLRSLKSGKSVALHTANSLWLEKTLPVEATYLKNSKLWFGTTPFSVDFRRYPVSSAKRINMWVSQKTNKRIPSLVPKNTLNATTRAVLVNAISFLAKWDSPFKSFRTGMDYFYPAPRYKVKVATMRREGYFLYSKAWLGHILLELPFKGKRFSFLIHLPASTEPFISLDLKTVRWAFPIPKRRRIKLSLPKMELKQKIFMKSLLRKFLPLSFSDRADFSGITKMKKGLVLSEVIHDTLLRVNEKGTEAAAATAVQVNVGATPPSAPVPEVKINRPFLFWIVEKTSGIVLFTGRVVNPDPKAEIMRRKRNMGTPQVLFEE